MTAEALIEGEAEAPRVPAKERRRLCWVAHELNRAMSKDLTVEATGEGKAALASGRVLQKHRLDEDVEYLIGGGSCPLTWVRVSSIKGLEVG